MTADVRNRQVSGGPWFTALEIFDPSSPAWDKYIDWSGIRQLRCLTSLDPNLCGSVFGETEADFWPHLMSGECFMFTDFGFLKSKVRDREGVQILAVFKNPDREPVVDASLQGFSFVGYDLLDRSGTASALSNCGGFPEVFSTAELSEAGLIRDFRRARGIQSLLAARYPQERHADCDIWALFVFDHGDVHERLSANIP